MDSRKKKIKVKINEEIYLIIRFIIQTSYMMNTNLKLHRYTEQMDFSFTYVRRLTCFNPKFIPFSFFLRVCIAVFCDIDKKAKEFLQNCQHLC
jgi:hypothetical protein